MAVCARCGRDVEENLLKEVAWEDGAEQKRELVCPNCLDELMNQADEVRGIAGQHKTAAAHLTGDSGEGERKSMEERE